MRNRNPFFIILVTTMVVFLGYHYSKEKVVQYSTAKKTQTTASIGVNSNEATVKDWDRLFKKIVNKMG